MIYNIIDNKNGLKYNEALALFENLFEKNFNFSYSFKDSKNYGMSFRLEYIINNYLFLFKSEKGYIEEYSITKDNKSINLYEYEPLLKNIETASCKNICFLVDTIKRYIDSKTQEN